jgi:hypothetical protein
MYESVLTAFPKIKLSCETIVHNKVYSADFMMLCPNGAKSFLWFTSIKNNDKEQNQNVCLFLEIDENKNNNQNQSHLQQPQFKIVKQMHCYYDCNLNQERGTILYGTMFKHVDHMFFTMEDVFYYKGKNVSNTTWIEKMALLRELIIHDTVQRFYKQTKYNDDSFVLGLPIICSQYTELNNHLENVKYSVKNIQFYNYCKKNAFESLDAHFYKTRILNPEPAPTPPTQTPIISVPIQPFSFSQIKMPTQKSMKHFESAEKNKYDKENNYNTNVINNNVNVAVKKEREYVFKVKADIQNDIYHLYCHDPNSPDKLAYYDIAYIPDYKTSVFMNKLYRIIKENDNLDALEESDDDEEFENEKEDRFVFLDKTLNMACVYNYKFKKWAPIRVEETNKKIANKYELSKYNKSQFSCN